MGLVLLEVADEHRHQIERLSDRLGLTYNIGPSLITAKSNGESDTSVNLSYAMALSGSVGGPFSLFGEFFGAFAFGSNRLDRHDFQAGTEILLSRLFQIDIQPTHDQRRTSMTS